MPNFKILIKVSLALLTVNFVLGGMVLFSRFRTELQKKETIEKTALAGVQGASSIPIFTPNMVISDEGFTSTRACPNSQVIQSILDRYNSPLRNYSVQGRSAASWIYTAARGESSSRYGVTPQLNPCLLVTYLEKEQSLLTGKFSGVELENRLGIAMGYGCPDNASCSEQYKGFVNQVNWAAYQLQYNFNLSRNTSVVDAYQLNRTIYTLDGINVFIQNAATAAAYRYTPHVYWGNYNVWKIMTANGWGSSSATYSYADLDRVNIPNKQTILNDQYANRIKEADVLKLLTNPPAMGTTSDEVKLLQEFLRQQGYFTYPVITGYYGTVTESARAAYLADKPRKDQVKNLCDPLYAKTWKQGETGDEVSKLQQCLKDEGLYAWPSITGYFGPVTEQGLTTIRSRKGTGSTTAPAPASPTPTSPTPSATKYTTNSKGVNSKGLNIRSEACGNQIGTASWGLQGVRLEGPVNRACFGGTWDWYKIQFDDGKIGWVAGFYLDATTLPTPKPVQSQDPKPRDPKATVVKTNKRGVASAGLNLRDGVCGNQIGTASWGLQGVRLEGPVNRACFGGTWDWYKIQFDDGKIGWVAGFYLDVISGKSNSGKKFRTVANGSTGIGVNARSEACGKILSQVPWGAEVIQVGGPTSKGCDIGTFDWYQVVTADGQTVWIAGNYLQKI